MSLNKEKGIIALIETIRVRQDLTGKQKRHRIRNLRQAINRIRGRAERARSKV